MYKDPSRNINERCQSDLTFTSDGLIPTLILNPHAFPSRMTYNQLVEAIVSKLGALRGTAYDGSFTITTDIKEVGAALMEEGYLANGTEIMFIGRTGKFTINTMFMAPTHYCRLQKFSEELGYAVGDNGQRSFTTRQPVAGRSREGGLKLGEMEKDCFNSHGSMFFYNRKLRNDCDGIDLYFCRCGYRAICNERKKIAYCKICESSSGIYRVPSRFASHLTLSLVEGLGTKFEFIPAPYKFLTN